MIEKKDKKFNIIGEYICYLYIISNFLNSKLNMKIGYLLLILGIIKLIFFREKITINKKIYGMFNLVFIIGIITNLMVSTTDGLSVFIEENGRFFYAMFLFTFLMGKDKTKKINFSIHVGVLLLSLGIIYNEHWEFLLNGSYTRQRGILIIGIIYVLINLFENILKKNYKELYTLPILILSLYSIIKLNSRMAVLVIIFCVILYLIFILFYRKKFKIKNLFIVIFLGGILTYNLLPQAFINRIKTSFQTKNNVSNEDRIVMWKAGVEIYKNNWLLGVGTSPRDVKPLLIEYVDKNVQKEVIRNEFIRDEKFSRLHSMYVDFFVQNGVFGILYIILLFGLIPYEFYKKKNETIATATFFSIVGFYTYGVTWSVWSDYGIIQELFQIMLAILLI